MIIKGDINGDGRITQEDFLLLQAKILERIELSDDQLIAADINNDGKVSITDLVALQKHLNGAKIINEVVNNG